MLQIQDVLNKGVKRGLILHLFQITHNFMLFTVPASLQGGVFSVGASGAYAQFQHIYIQDQLK